MTTLFPSAIFVHPYVLLISLSSTNSNPFGRASTITVPLASISASLYTLISYTTVSPLETLTGFFACLYTAVVLVPFFNPVTSTVGTLFTVSSFTFIIYFLKARSSVLLSIS